jgi:hypothetical protein
LNKIEIGNKQTAVDNGWVSMAEGKTTYGEDAWLKKVVGLTAFTQE